MRKFLRIGIYIFVILIIMFVGVFGVSLHVKNSTKNQVISKSCSFKTGRYYYKIGDVDCIVVLGAGLFGNKPSPMLEDRLVMALDLYENNVSKKIIVTGDHGTKDHDEPSVMKEFLVKRGVPSENIFMDHAGFSTYDSMYRAKEIFGAKSMVVVTQKYHLYRSLYVANKLGIEAYGVCAKDIDYVGDTYRETREIFARFKDVVKCVFKPKPKFLGAKIPLNQSGDIT